MDNIIVFKCGGSSVADLSDDFFENIKSLQKQGVKPVIVHGGGPAIKEGLDKLNIKHEFVDGLRKTSDEMIDVVEKVLSGSVNSALTRKFNKHQLKAIGLSGTDNNLIVAKPINYSKYGLVGEVEQVNVNLLHVLLSANYIPVISPLAVDTDGNRYNVNADTAAGTIASSLNAEQLIFVTDVSGILKHGELIEEVTIKEIETLIEEKIIYGGMIPKVKAALNGLAGDVKEVKIINGKNSMLTNDNQLLGTTIKTN